ncbi:MAG: acyl-homoserine-lactone synthase [Paracoccaceae bacterium]
MIRYMTPDALDAAPELARSMFRDRAAQFRDRLGWDVQVDAAGEERDAYDDAAPLYVRGQGRDGAHGGSMRFLPTSGETMVNDHFRHLVDGMWLASADTWECSRFCLAASAGREVAPALLLGALELGLACGLRHDSGCSTCACCGSTVGWAGCRPSLARQDRARRRSASVSGRSMPRGATV